jgi:hypothetical protein
MASIIVWFDEYVPVPTIKRERNSRPAIVSGNGSRDGSTAVAAISTTSYEMNDLHDVTAGERLCRVSVTISQNGAVVLDYDEARVNTERAEKLR